MNLDYKKVLYIDLDELSYEFKHHENLWEYVGGIGVSYKLFNDNFERKPTILSSGPLSGYFPYISKAHLLYFSNGSLVDKYGGGSIAGMMNMSGLDSIVFLGNTKKYIHISIFQQEITISEETEDEFEAKDVDFVLRQNMAISQKYFSFGQGINLNKEFTGGVSVNIDSTVSIDFADQTHYEALYNDFLEEYKRLSVEPRSNPSCLGCPMGCDKSHLGEDGENVAILPRCLIACAYAEDVYKEIPNAYACLNSVGYKYTHSQLEGLPQLIGDLRLNLNSKINEEELS